MTRLITTLGGDILAVAVFTHDSSAGRFGKPRCSIIHFQSLLDRNKGFSAQRYTDTWEIAWCGEFFSLLPDAENIIRINTTLGGNVKATIFNERLNKIYHRYNEWYPSG